jgi:ABC-type amino acid transport substrate-binding protein
MNRPCKVFIGSTPDSVTIVDTDPAVLRSAQAEILSVMAFDEYLKLGHHEVNAVLNDGRVSLTLSERAAKAKRKREILSLFEEIDRSRVRPVASIAQNPNADDKAYLKRLNNAAAELRAELSNLEKS